MGPKRKYMQYLWDNTCDIPRRSKYRLKQMNAAFDEGTRQNSTDGVDMQTRPAAVEETLSTNSPSGAAANHTDSEKADINSAPIPDCEDFDFDSEVEEDDGPSVTISTSNSSDSTECESSCPSESEDEVERIGPKDTELVRIQSPLFI